MHEVPAAGGDPSGGGGCLTCGPLRPGLCAGCLRGRAAGAGASLTRLSQDAAAALGRLDVLAARADAMARAGGDRAAQLRHRSRAQLARVDRALDATRTRLHATVSGDAEIDWAGLDST